MADPLEVSEVRVTIPLHLYQQQQLDMRRLEEGLEEVTDQLTEAQENTRRMAGQVRELTHQVEEARALPGRMHMAWRRMLEYLGVKGRGHTAVLVELRRLREQGPPYPPMERHEQLVKDLQVLCRTHEPESDTSPPVPEGFVSQEQEAAAPQEKMLRLVGTYAGVRWGGLAIPEPFTAQQLFECIQQRATVTVEELERTMRQWCNGDIQTTEEAARALGVQLLPTKGESEETEAPGVH